MKKIIAFGIAIVLSISTTVFADVESYKVTYDDTYINISGTLTEGQVTEYVILEILKSGESFEDLKNDVSDFAKVYHIDQKSIESGERMFEFKLGTEGVSGKMKASISGQGFKSAEYFEIDYVKQSDYSTVCKQVNAAAKVSFDEFVKLCTQDNNMYTMGFVLPEDSQNDDQSGVLRLLYNYAASCEGDAFDTSDREHGKQLFNTSYVALLLNEERVSSLLSYADMIDLSEERVKEWFDFISDDDTAMARLTQLMTNRDFADCNAFDKKLKEAIVLTVVQYPNGYANVTNVMKAFTDVTGITSVQSEICRKLAEGSYDTIAKLVSAYKSYSTTKGSDTTVSSNRGGGTGGSSGVANVIAEREADSNENQTVKMTFIDLDTVAWAYEAISTLTDRGIINGKSEQFFAPSDNITREEFVKILVGALGRENESYENIYTDVNADEWYAKYVNTASRLGICQGIGNGKFGIGQEISRQDMAVMIYNALGENAVAKDGEQKEFADMSLISDYAKTAVDTLSRMGAINGDDTGRFNPTDSATRAEAAKMIFGVIDLLN